MRESKLRSVLLIAYHYPPCAMSSGVQRSLSFSLNLPRHGWRPVVLTVDPNNHPAVAAYERIGYREACQLVEASAARRDPVGLLAALRRFRAAIRRRSCDRLVPEEDPQLGDGLELRLERRLRARATRDRRGEQNGEEEESHGSPTSRASPSIATDACVTVESQWVWQNSHE